MHRDRHLAEFILPNVVPVSPAVAPFGMFVPCIFGSVIENQWAEVYRIARERTVEALRPTHYDRALGASIN